MVIFDGMDSAGNDGIWKTDGTGAGTVEIAAAHLVNDPGGLFGYPASDFQAADFTIFNGKIIFQGWDSLGNIGLWETDGTSTSEIFNGFESQTRLGFRPEGFTPLNGKLLFSGGWQSIVNGSAVQHGRTLWVTDGTQGGTANLTISGISTIGLGLDPYDFSPVFNGKVIFWGTNVASQFGYGLWATDGTSAGTAALSVAQLASAPMSYTLLNGKLLFNAEDAAAFLNGNSGLWVSDGTAAGTTELAVSGASVSFGLRPSNLTVFNGKVVFEGIGTTDTNGNFGLWVTDGTSAGTTELAVSGAKVGGFNPFNFTLFNGKLFFIGEGADGNRDLWQTDGTSSGTTLVKSGLSSDLGSGSGLSILTTLAGPDQAPVATASSVTAAHGQSSAAASILVGATDVDGDTITQYALWDTQGNGHWVVNGITQATNAEIDITAAQLAQTSYVFGSATDTLYVRANDGLVWGGWLQFTASPFLNHAPVASATNVTATHGQTSAAASSLVGASDADNDAITQYALFDSTGSGHWVVNGVAQGTNVEIDITAAQLALTSYVFGSATDTLYVRANDGTVWGGWLQFSASPFANHVPVSAAPDFNATHNQNIAASALFTTSDADNDPIAAYQFWDSTTDPSSGHWVVNGVAQSANVAIDVTAAQLASTTFQSGSGSDDLYVRANDGTAWGAWKEFHVNAPIDNAPVVTASDFAATHGQNIAAGSLFSVTDADNDSIAKYQFWDATADPASGHFVVGGVAQGSAVAIDVSAAQLASTTFQSGSGSDDLYVRANDGFAWSAWKEFHVSAPVDHAPVVTAPDFHATPNQTVAASNLFSVTDAENDSITKYQVFDSTANVASGHWNVGGAAQGTNVAIDVTAAQLASTTFQGGAVPDDLWVRANDGTQWSQWQEFHWIV
jgi:ELWxxDGT repeat protein